VRLPTSAAKSHHAHGKGIRQRPFTAPMRGRVGVRISTRLCRGWWGMWRGQWRHVILLLLGARHLACRVGEHHLELSVIVIVPLA
jgi:hypothetical protein